MLQIKVFVRVKTSNDISITEYLHEILESKTAPLFTTFVIPA